MRLLLGFATAPAPARPVAVARPGTQIAAAHFLEAVAFEVLPAVTWQAHPAADLLRARTAIELYSRVSKINSEQPVAALNIYG
jgi:hypothetical protein